jgi:hypothetical protein
LVVILNQEYNIIDSSIMGDCCSKDDRVLNKEITGSLDTYPISYGYNNNDISGRDTAPIKGPGNNAPRGPTGTSGG